MKLNEASKTAKRKSFLMLFSLVLILVFAVGGTIAYIVTSTNDVQNTFEPARVSCLVKESFNGQTKSDVQIQNTGDIDAYIRAMIVVSWKDAQGNVYGGGSPSEKDYALTLNTQGDDHGKWFQGTDGYYYFTKPVSPNGYTGVLISECKLNDGIAPPDGYNFSVEILADAIQSVPDSAVHEAWGATVTNGALQEQ